MKSTIPTIEAMSKIKVVALYFWGRSGTLLMHSLLDSHPEVLNLPSLMLMSFHHEQWEEINKYNSLEQRLDAFIRLNIASFDGKQDINNCGFENLGPNKNTCLSVDQALFKKYMHEILQGISDQNSPRKYFFIAAHFAYALARGEDISTKKVLLYHLHSSNDLTRIGNVFADFPDMLSLGMLRHPLRGFNSHIRAARTMASKNSSDARLREAYMSVLNTDYRTHYKHQLVGWTTVQRKYPHAPFLEVQLEQLHENPRREMERVASFLNIAWNDSLLESTFNGLAFWADTSARNAINGFSVQHTKYEDWQDNFDTIDTLVLNGLLKKFVEKHGYGKVSRKTRLLLPLLILKPSKLELEALRKGGLLRLPFIINNILARYIFSYLYLVGYPIDCSEGYLAELERKFWKGARIFVRSLTSPEFKS